MNDAHERGMNDADEFQVIGQMKSEKGRENLGV